MGRECPSFAGISSDTYLGSFSGRRTSGYRVLPCVRLFDLCMSLLTREPSACHNLHFVTLYRMSDDCQMPPPSFPPQRLPQGSWQVIGQWRNKESGHLERRCLGPCNEPEPRGFRAKCPRPCDRRAPLSRTAPNPCPGSMEPPGWAWPLTLCSLTDSFSPPAFTFSLIKWA